MSLDLKSYDADILFQKMGNTWYLFTQIGEEVIFSELPPGINPKSAEFELYEVLEEHVEKVNRTLEAA